MICPNCGHDNLPGSEECDRCKQDLTQLDRPAAQDRIEQTLMDESVQTLSPRTPVTVPPSATVAEALRLMQEIEIGALLIVGADGKLLGILTERDVLTKIAGLHENFSDLNVLRFATENPETVTTEDKLAFALQKMDVGGYRHLPVLKDGLPVGVVSVRDLVHHITRVCHYS